MWIPPYHFLPIYRLIVWFLLVNLAFRELYNDILTWNSDKRREEPISGRYRWMTCAVELLEIFISFKLTKDSGEHVINAPTPTYIWVPWATVLAGMIIFYIYLRFKPGHTTIYGNEK